MPLGIYIIDFLLRIIAAILPKFALFQHACQIIRHLFAVRIHDRFHAVKSQLR